MYLCSSEGTKQECELQILVTITGVCSYNIIAN